MIYKCEKCHYLFALDQALTDLQGNRYRCPDCGKFGVRIADVAECEEYRLQEQAVKEWEASLSKNNGRI